LSIAATPAMGAGSEKLYEQLAADLEGMIRSGVLRPGDRLPSTRFLSRSRGISLSTVFQACYLLEARGLLRSRERSGWFVTAANLCRPPQPDAISRPPTEARTPDMGEMVFKILQRARERDSAGLASALPAPSLFPLARLWQALSRAGRSAHPQQVLDDLTPGNARLIRHIARLYQAQGIAVAEQEIIITNGALEALHLCLASLTRAGDAVIVESPTFYGALQALETLGLRAVQVPTHPTHGIDLAALDSALRRHAPRACWLMPNFQNPLGSLMPRERKRELVELLARHDVPLIEDDVYGELFFDEERPPPARAFDTGARVLHCSSFSKCLAPGFRIGWVAAGRHAHDIAKRKLGLSVSTSLPPQLALAEYLDHGGFQRHLHRLRARLASQQVDLAGAVHRHFPPGTLATRPRGGYFLWVELPVTFDAMLLYRHAAAQGICIAPGPLFSADQAFRNCLRLNYSCPVEGRVQHAVATLGRLLSQQRGAG
jgi:DNA-binding transcriptional MocR family regulator